MTLLEPASPDREHPRHVDIVSGSFGAGHDAAARALAAQLHQEGIPTRTWDIVDMVPGRLGTMVRSGYLRQVQSMPATWRWTLDAIEHHEGLARSAVRAIASTQDALLEMAADRPSLVVSTHPFPSQALGRLRGEGRLDVPVATYLTDMSVHRLWVHRDVDLHLAVHELPAMQARRLGAGLTIPVEPAVPERFASVDRTSLGRSLARTAFGLPVAPHRRLALVTGGSCGIGRLYRAAIDLAATGVVTPVVLCGTNTQLLERVRRHPRMIGLGWVSDMPSLYAAVDLVVQNSGGMTSLEARAAGLPVLTYRCVAGHGETNAAALDAAGLATWVRDPESLRDAVTRALRSPSDQLGTARPRAARTLVDALLPAPALIA